MLFRKEWSRDYKLREQEYDLWFTVQGFGTVVLD